MAGRVQLDLLEQGLNRILMEDPDSPARLATLVGRTLRIDSWLHDEASVFITFREDGIRLDTEHEGHVDASLSGGPASLLRSALNPSDRTVFSDGTLAVQGDAALVQSFADLFRLYDPDWQQRVSPVIGETLTWRIETAIDALGEWRASTRRKLVADTGDYLREETRLLASRDAVAAFADAVDTLVSDAARLEQRIARLEKKLT